MKIYSEELWLKIKKDIELKGLSFREVAKIYTPNGPTHSTISRKAKKEGWIKGKVIIEAGEEAGKAAIKSVVDINLEYDELYEELTGKVKETLETGEVLEPVAINLHASTLKTIRGERLEIRGKLTPHQQVKLDMDREKFEHKKKLDERKPIPKKPTKNSEGNEKKTIHLG